MPKLRKTIHLLCLPLTTLSFSLSSSSYSAMAAPSQSPTSVESAFKIQYESAFVDFKPFQETDTGSWRELNDSVKQSGHIDHEMSGQGHEQMQMDMNQDKEMPLNHEHMKH